MTNREVAGAVHARFDRWWNGVSLRAKVTGVVVALLAFGLTIAGAGTITVLNSYLLEQVDSQIDGALSTIDQPFQIEQARPYGGGSGITTPYYIGAISADGTIVADNLDESYDEVRPVLADLTLIEVAKLEGHLTVTNEAGTAQWRITAVPFGVGVGTEQATLVVGRSLGDMNRIIGRYTAIFLAFSLGVLLMSAAAAQLLVTSAFAPLRDVERTAARFAAGDYSQRLGGATPNTEVGRLNRSLNTMLARIDRAFADRDRSVDQMRRFVGDASHELRTPLVSLRGYAELYRMGALSSKEEVGQAMDRIEREAIRMGTLVEDLLELARLDEVDRPLERKPLDLLPIAQDAVLDASASAPERRITLVLPGPADAAQATSASEPTEPVTVVDPPDDHPVGVRERAALARAARRPGASAGAFSFAGTRLARLRRRRPDAASATQRAETSPLGPIVLAEEDKVRQVVTNLMGNALRFTPPDTPIEVVVEVDRDRRFGVISVVDHGDGIPPQLREKIFQRLWRADTSRTRDTGGSGLGLAIVAGIVAAHQGHVEVLETPGGGATFRVSLPQPPLPTTETEAPSPAPPRGGRGRAPRR